MRHLLNASIPWGDWQFWVVTLLALGCLVVVIRPLLPGREQKAGCPGCASDKGRTRPHHAQLTIGGEKVPRAEAASRAGAAAGGGVAGGLER